ncbi:conserved hypothetical protein [Histoplasma capsulatum G186AR]|uniref:Uncharacterized protein n=2 Tax=Ajellomyces capsulatus TaxID=5037 RepID=C0NKQ6_AJECG|nr:uncharacterized protein HCBG_03736 [Histoplasma capsulatum G186AR]EEH08447.1 conserved hypothetical protein [Histoplasma capsulatum G186AR]KAG5299238.1 hypothetical protein I7I52_09484 [Histoplasma capsulatum]QSS68142.1 hypothetical protein I7I50_07444 [Histoplasma capsulatum G186AR]
MYIPDQPQNDAFAWATTTSACEQRGCPISDAAGMKKRKRDTTNWDNQVNASMGSCTAFIPGNAQHIDDKSRSGYSQLLGESSSGSITSKFAPWPIPERRTHPFRPCLQPTAIKRRRLIQQQQNQQSQQEWSTIPISMYAGQKPQHLYSTDPGSSLPPKSPSSSLHKTKPNTHHNNDPSTSSSQNKPSSNITLFPCHICHRRPTTRSTLDAYADCDLCAERTCYICLRECMAVDCNYARSPPNPYSGRGKENNNSNTSNTINENDCRGKGSCWRGKTAPSNSRPGRGGEEENGPRTGRKVCSWCAVESVVDGGAEVVRCFACVAGW